MIMSHQKANHNHLIAISVYCIPKQHNSFLFLMGINGVKLTLYTRECESKR